MPTTALHSKLGASQPGVLTQLAGTAMCTYNAMACGRRAAFLACLPLGLDGSRQCIALRQGARSLVPAAAGSSSSGTLRTAHRMPRMRSAPPHAGPPRPWLCAQLCKAAPCPFLQRATALRAGALHACMHAAHACCPCMPPAAARSGPAWAPLLRPPPPLRPRSRPSLDTVQLALQVLLEAARGHELGQHVVVQLGAHVVLSVAAAGHRVADGLA